MAAAGDLKALQAEFDKAVDEVQKKVEDVFTFSIKDGVQFIGEISPVFTGYYQSNHRVTLNSSEFPLDPITRPSSGGTGALKVPPAALRAREEQNLKPFKLGDEIKLGNAVPYAGDLEAGTPKQPAGGFYDTLAQAIEQNMSTKSKSK